MINYETHLLFPTPLWKTNIKKELTENNLTIKNLIKDCLSIKQKDKGRKFSNKGANSYQSNDIYFDLKDQKLELCSLMRIVDNLVQTIYKNIWEGQIILDNSWININGKDSFNALHSHPQCVLSGCIYIKTPFRSGCFNAQRNFNETFIYDNYGTPKKESPESFITDNEIQITPKEGDILVFPSHVIHRVKPNENNEERISIAFNYVR